MRKIRTSALLVLILAILFYLFFDFTKHAPNLGAANPFSEDPYDAIGSFGIQLALFAALLTLVRAFRPYQQKDTPVMQTLLLRRGEAVALLTVAVTLISDAIGLVRAVIEGGIFPEAEPLAALLGGMLSLTLVVGWEVSLSARETEASRCPHPWGRAVIISSLAVLLLAFYPLVWRESGILGGIFTAVTGVIMLFATVWGIATAIFPIMGFAAYEDIFIDLAAIWVGLRERLHFVKGLFAWLEKTAGLPLVRKLIGWLSPRKHRWNLVVLVAVTVGSLLVMAEIITEGAPGQLGRFLMMIVIYVGIEALGVTLGYAFLGKYLGIY